MAEALIAELKEKIAKMDVSQESITNLSAFFLDNYESAHDFIEVWFELLKAETSDSKLLPYIYVANDVIQRAQGKKKTKQIYVAYESEMKTKVAEAIRICARVTKDIGQLTKVVNKWGERAIFHKDVIYACNKALKSGSSSPSARRNSTSSVRSGTSDDDNNGVSIPVLKVEEYSDDDEDMLGRINDETSQSAFGIDLKKHKLAEDEEVDSPLKKRKLVAANDQDKEAFALINEVPILSLVAEIVAQKAETDGLRATVVQANGLLCQSRTELTHQLENRMIPLPEGLLESAKNASALNLELKTQLEIELRRRKRLIDMIAAELEKYEALHTSTKSEIDNCVSMTTSIQSLRAKYKGRNHIKAKLRRKKSEVVRASTDIDFSLSAADSAALEAEKDLNKRRAAFSREGSLLTTAIQKTESWQGDVFREK